MKVRDIMTRDVEIVHPDTSLKEAAARMRQAETGFLPIGEGDRLVGTITDRDMALRAVAEGKDPNTTPVSEAMSPDIIYVYDDQDTTEAAQIMSEQQVRRLAVLNRDKRLVGIVSQGDLAVRTADDDIVGQTVEDISEPEGKHQQ